MDELNPGPTIGRGGGSDDGEPRISFGYPIEPKTDAVILREQLSALITDIMKSYDGTPPVAATGTDPATDLFRNAKQAMGGNDQVAGFTLQLLSRVLDNLEKVTGTNIPSGQFFEAMSGYFADKAGNDNMTLRTFVDTMENIKSVPLEAVNTMIHEVAGTVVLPKLKEVTSPVAAADPIIVREGEGRIVFNPDDDVDVLDLAERGPSLVYRLMHPSETLALLREQRTIRREEEAEERRRQIQEEQAYRSEFGTKMPWLAFLTLKIMQEGQTRITITQKDDVDALASAIQDRLGEIAEAHPGGNGPNYLRIRDHVAAMHTVMRDGPESGKAAYGVVLGRLLERLNASSAAKIFPLDHLSPDIFGNKHVHAALAAQPVSKTELQFLEEYLDTITVRPSIGLRISSATANLRSTGSKIGAWAEKTLESGLNLAGRTYYGGISFAAASLASMQARYANWQESRANPEPKESRFAKIGASVSDFVERSKTDIDAWRARRAEAREQRAEERAHKLAEARANAAPKESSVDWEPLRAKWNERVVTPWNGFKQEYLVPFLAKLRTDSAAIRNHFTSGEWRRSQALQQEEESEAVIALPDLSDEQVEREPRVTLGQRGADLYERGKTLLQDYVVEPAKNLYRNRLVPLGTAIATRWDQAASFLKRNGKGGEAPEGVIMLPDLSDGEAASAKGIRGWLQQRRDNRDARNAAAGPRESSIDWEKVEEARARVRAGWQNAKAKYVTPFVGEIKDGWNQLNVPQRAALFGVSGTAVMASAAAMMMAMMGPASQAAPDMALASSPAPVAAPSAAPVSPPAASVVVVTPKAAAVAPASQRVAPERVASAARVAPVRVTTPVAVAAPTGNLDGLADIIRGLAPDNTVNPDAADVTGTFGSAVSGSTGTDAPADDAGSGPDTTINDGAPENLLETEQGTPLFDFSAANRNGNIDNVLDTTTIVEPLAEPLPIPETGTDTEPQTGAEPPEAGASDAAAPAPLKPAALQR